MGEQNEKEILGCFVIVVLLAVLAAIPLAGYYLYFKPNDEVVPAFAEGELVLVVEGERYFQRTAQRFWKVRCFFLSTL